MMLLRLTNKRLLIFIQKVSLYENHGYYEYAKAQNWTHYDHIITKICMNMSKHFISKQWDTTVKDHKY